MIDLPKTIALTTAINAKYRMEDACRIASELNLPYLDPENLNSTKNNFPFDYLLIFEEANLALKKCATKSILRIDFARGHLHYRSQKANMRNELLARAIGIKPYQNPLIIDATAGLGRDSFILASLGYSVTLLERAPIVHLLLADALHNAKLLSKLAPIMARMTLFKADALAWLNDKHADIIYLDPMFPKRGKSASVKKASGILQDLLPSDGKDNDLFAAAFACATKRVVIKRPRLSANLANQKPSFSLKGNSCRFDVYLV